MQLLKASLPKRNHSLPLINNTRQLVERIFNYPSSLSMLLFSNILALSSLNTSGINHCWHFHITLVLMPILIYVHLSVHLIISNSFIVPQISSIEESPLVLIHCL